MYLRVLRTSGKIAGGILVVIVLLLAIGPFLIPATSQAGLMTPLQVATDESRFVTIPFDGTDGIDIHYLVGSSESDRVSIDEAPTFVLLHGSLFNAFTWNNVMSFFSEQGQVVAYDQIPYGLSEKLVPGDWTGTNPYTSAAAVDQLFLFLDALGIGKVVLVGHSYGGALAAQAAMLQPDRVQAIIFVDAAVYVHEEMPAWFLNLPQVNRLGPRFARLLEQNDAVLRQMYLNPDPLVAERLYLTRVNTQVENWDVALWEYLRAWGADPLDLDGRVSGIQQPVLVITGDSDAIVPMADSQRLDAELPHSQLAVLPSCGHVPQEECPAAFEDAVEAWLNQ